MLNVTHKCKPNWHLGWLNRLVPSSGCHKHAMKHVCATSGVGQAAGARMYAGLLMPDPELAEGEFATVQGFGKGYKRAEWRRFGERVGQPVG